MSIDSTNLCTMDVIESKDDDAKLEALSVTQSDSMKLNFLNDCEAKVFSILQITQDTLSELQNVPDINAARLNSLSKEYLDLVMFLQSELKSASQIISADDISVSKSPTLSNDDIIIEDNNNLIIKRIEIVQARNYLKASNKPS